MSTWTWRPHATTVPTCPCSAGERQESPIRTQVSSGSTGTDGFLARPSRVTLRFSKPKESPPELSTAWSLAAVNSGSSLRAIRSVGLILRTAPSEPPDPRKSTSTCRPHATTVPTCPCSVDERQESPIRTQVPSGNTGTGGFLTRSRRGLSPIGSSAGSSYGSARGSVDIMGVV